MTGVYFILLVSVVVTLGIIAIIIINNRYRWTNRTTDAIRADHRKLVSKRLTPLTKKVPTLQERERLARERQRDAEAAARDYGRPSTAKLVILPPLALFWLFMFVLQVILDIQITRGLLRDDNLLATILGFAIAIAISGFALYWSWKLVHEGGSNQRNKAYIVVAGLVILTIMVGVVVAIAPNRSQSSHLGDDVVAAQKAYDNAKSLYAEGALDQLSLDVAHADLVAAQTKLEAAKNVDRAYAVIVPIVEIVLSFAAVAAGEMFLWIFAMWRARRHRRTADGLRQAVLGLRGEMTQHVARWQQRVSAKLLRHNRPGELLTQFDEREGESERAKLLMSIGASNGPTGGVPPRRSAMQSPDSTPGTAIVLGPRPAPQPQPQPQPGITIISTMPPPSSSTTSTTHTGGPRRQAPTQPLYEEEPTNPMWPHRD